MRKGVKKRFYLFNGTLTTLNSKGGMCHEIKYRDCEVHIDSLGEVSVFFPKHFYHLFIFSFIHLASISQSLETKWRH